MNDLALLLPGRHPTHPTTNWKRRQRRKEPPSASQPLLRPDPPLRDLPSSQPDPHLQWLMSPHRNTAMLTQLLCHPIVVNGIMSQDVSNAGIGPTKADAYAYVGCCGYPQHPTKEVPIL